MKHVRCGTFGCNLTDLHAGLHIYPPPLSRFRDGAKLPPPISRSKSISDAELLLDLFNTPPPKFDVTPEYEIEECFQLSAAGKPSEIIRKEVLPSLRVKRRWSASETGFNRACWYKGKITKLSGDKTQVFIHYDDGDKEWENLSEIVFL